MRFKLALVVLAMMLLGGCASRSDESADALIVVEPQEPDVRYQLEVARANEMLSAQFDLEPEQLAQVHYRRATLFDAMGLTALSRLDLNYALELNPRLADAYNYLGFQYAQAGYFERAYETLEALLELDPEHPYVYLNRGLVAYYDQRYDLAVDDFEVYFKQQPDDPYRALWLYFATLEEDPNKARRQLAQQRVEFANEQWAWYLSDLFLGVISEQEFLERYAQALLAEDETLAERMCEVYFYLGKLKAIQGNPKRAAVYFRLALTTNVYMFVEHRFAKLELEALSPDRDDSFDNYY